MLALQLYVSQLTLTTKVICPQHGLLDRKRQSLFRSRRPWSPIVPRKALSSMYFWGHGKLGRCVIQLSKFLYHTLATHKQA
jgi:hypothetical protein